MNPRPLLEVQELVRHFGGVVALRGVDFTVAPGQIKALIGPNGAGKTTIFNVISGLLAPTRGRVLFDGAPLPVCRPPAVAARGIARTFQLVRLFGEMTVLDHVLVGCHRRGRAAWAACAFRTRAMRAEERRLRDRALEILDLLGLGGRAESPAAALPYGEQRLVEVGRALGMKPTLLLLDEPGAGLDPREQDHLAALVRRIRDGGTTVLLVDHHMDFVMDLSDEVLVLCSGEKLAEGPPAAVRCHPDVIAAYLGEEAA
ncbi:MAG: ABC transporter ATP-binding protein [Candidatus Rokubacteria bacterium]|nr:ABC transporter ATP-binding protein [Candidatus Rokubacteria bacterium]